jgi:outer membrane protein OmpU
MKSILLTSTALVAFAGTAMAAAHEDSTPNGVAWGADGEFGYNEEVEGGFYFEGGLALSTSAGMNMGLTAGVTLDVDLGFNEAVESVTVATGSGDGAFDNISIDGSDFVVFVEGQGAAVYIGDTETASEKTWSGTTNLQNDGFLEVDDINDGADKGDFIDGVIRGDMTYGPVTGSVSFMMTNGTGENGDYDGIDGMQVGAVSTLGAYTFGVTYQEGVTDRLINATDSVSSVDGLGNVTTSTANPGTVDELVGMFASTTFAGANVKVAYAQNMDTDADSTGLQLDYPFGPVVATVFYSFESDTDDNYGVAVAYANGPVAASAYYHDGTDQEIGLEGSYDTGMGLTAYAGYIQNDDDSDATEAYVAGVYDLGGGASLIAAYGDAGDTYKGLNDEIGNSFEVNEGTTVAISFKF